MDEYRDAIASCCKQLRLSVNLAENAMVQDGESHQEYLYNLFNEEIRYRKASRVTKYINTAGFPYTSTFSDFNPSEVQFPSDVTLDSLKALEFIKDKAGKLTGVKTVALEWKAVRGGGRPQMQQIEGSEEVLEADLVLIAAGFLGSEDYVAEDFGVDRDGRMNVSTDKGGYATSVTNVFAAGDMRRGQSLVVWAISEGRNAARAVDESLMGYSNL